MVMVTDTCAGCAPGELSLQALAFSKLADPGVGRLNVSYEKVRHLPGGLYDFDLVRIAALFSFGRPLLLCCFGRFVRHSILCTGACIRVSRYF